MTISRWWVLVAFPILILAGVALAATLRRLVRTTRAAVLTSVPLAPATQVTFAEPGEFGLSIETVNGFGGVYRFRALRWAIVGADGRQLRTWRSPSNTRVSSFSRMRVEVARVAVPAAGTYAVHVDGVELPAVKDRAAIVVTRPFGFQLVLYILAMIALGAILICSLIVAIVAATGARLQPA